MYGLDSDNLPKRKLPFPIGECISDCELSSCEFVDGGSWQAIDFTWIRSTDDGDQELRDRRFAVNEDSITPKSGESTEDAVQRAYANFNGIVKHIGSKFVEAEELSNIKGDNFREFATNYCEIINANCSGTKMYVKTLPNNNGYAKMSTYPRFCQTMESGDCELAYTPREKSILRTQEDSTSGVTESPTGEPSSYL